MGGGGGETETSPSLLTSGTDSGDAYCAPTSMTKSTTAAANVTHSHHHHYHHHPILNGISLEPFKLRPSAKIGLSCLCPDDPNGAYCETLDYYSRKTYSGCPFGPAPSRMEVETAMADLQRLMRGEARANVQWLQPIVCPSDSGILLNPGFGRFQNAFGMLQREPTVQNMVVNISSDKAFWDAIMNNKAVQNLQGSISAEQNAQSLQMQTSSEESDRANLILKWILGITKSKIGNVIEKIGVVMAELFLPGQKEKPTSELTDLVEEKIRSSVLLSVVILLVVVVTRNNGA